MKSLLKTAALLLLIGAGISFWMIDSLTKWSLAPIEISQAPVVDFERGTRLEVLAQVLERDKVIDSAWKFHLWTKFFGHYSRFQAGRYKFPNQTSPQDIASMMMAGKTWQEVVLQFVIPEGFTVYQVVDRLIALGVGNRKQVEEYALQGKLLLKHGITAKTLEGYLYPATYTFTKMPKPQEVFEKMISTFFEKLPPGIEYELAQKNLSLHSAVIFASLIERETLLDNERSLISEVIWNRLKTGEPLGIDAALIYGITNYQGDIKTVHLKDAKNLYNTRIHKGLPPGPIGSVSLPSLKAILTPTQFGYRFYVLGTDGAKSHHFSRTLEEHTVKVKELIKASRKP